MSHRTILSAAVLATAGLLLSGCAETTFEVPKTPNPVMLSPVDRIGGHVADPTDKSVGYVMGQVQFLSVAKTSQQKQGSVTVQKTEGYDERLTVGPFLKSVLEKTDGQDERTVRIRKVMIAAYLFHIGGYAEIKHGITTTADVMTPAQPATAAAATASTDNKPELAHVSR